MTRRISPPLECGILRDDRRDLGSVHRKGRDWQRRRRVLLGNRAGADAQTKSLIDLVQGLKVPQLVKNALADTLGLALRAEARGANQLACAELQLFRFEVGLDLQLKLLSPAQAAALDKAAVQIRAVLGCQ